MAIFAVSFLRGIVITFQFLYNFVLIGILYHSLARRYFCKKLIRESGKMNLEYQQSEYYHEFGTLLGKRNGYEIAVRIDSSGTVTTGVYVTIKSPVPFAIAHLDLAHQKPLKRPSKDEYEFATDNKLFNRIFKTRRADEKTAQRLCSSKGLLDGFVQFYLRWMFRLHYLSIHTSRNEFKCKLNYGNPWTAYIPPKTLETLIKDLVELMMKFEEVFQQDPQSRIF
jgi:hypothetical protein